MQNNIRGRVFKLQHIPNTKQKIKVENDIIDRVEQKMVLALKFCIENSSIIKELLKKFCKFVKILTILIT